MTSLRARLSAIVLMAAFLTAAAVPLFAKAAGTPPCAEHDRDDCSLTGQVKECCLLEEGGRSDDATPPAAKIHAPQPLADATVVVAIAAPVLPGLLRHARATAAAPRSSPADLITLFGTFLI